ncbi:MAG TPA: hypothetical protein VD903_01120 [Pseudonocardia sp.]|nr:hypothetical protein [Pseudonocardia sp.]
MGGFGRVEVGPVPEDDAPLARHLGATVLAAVEEHEPLTGRVAATLTFPAGQVRCESWNGDIRITGSEPRR